jgi:hypothetical protein
MRWHVRQILPVIAEQYRSGGIDLCSAQNVSLVLDHYNRINELLMNRHDWPGSDDHICLPVFESTFALPSRFESIKAFRVNGEALPILPLGFQYLQSGPGILTKNDGMNALQHLGSHFATMRDPTQVLPVFAISNETEEAARVTIHGADAFGNECRETITAEKSYPENSPQCTKASFKSIHAITKPVTAGHIEIAQWNDSTGEVTWLSSIPPDETAPTVTRYMLPGVERHCPVHLIANVSLAYREVSDIEDVSLIQHREAYRLMTQALSAFDLGDPGKGSQFQNAAMKLLKERAAKLAQGQNVALPYNPPRQFRKPYSIRGY